jgi:hypothetical protein
MRFPRVLWARHYLVDGAHARRASLDAGLLPPPLSAITLAMGQDPETLRVRSRADVARLGTFDVEETVRLRAFYWCTRRPSSLRIQAGGDRLRPGIHRSLAAQQVVARHVPELAPALLAHGSLPDEGVAFLQEAVVAGRHPATAGDVRNAMAPLLALFARLHDAVGVESRPLSAVVSRHFPERWDALARTDLVRGPVDRAVRQLINQDARVPVSLGHGDLVKSNMLFANDSVVLIDWEHARAMPIAFDLSKLVFRAGAVASAVELIRQHWKGSLAATRDGYRVEEQLALGLAQMLAWTASREQRAKAIGRAEAFRLDSQRRV